MAKGLVVADHRDPADHIMIVKTGIVEICLAIDSKVFYNSIGAGPTVELMLLVDRLDASMFQEINIEHNCNTRHMAHGVL